MIQAIAEARAQGDLSENAEYEAAKERQGFIEGRIAEIEGKLAAAQIIDPAALDAGGRVVFGADRRAGGSGHRREGDLPDRRRGRGRPEAGHDLRVQLPIARALIGKEEGDTAEVQAPGGIKRYEIVAVNYV